jgi:menaquinone-dependent protoporphyrinogen oxidase
MKVSVITATRHGSTFEVAETIAGRLTELGHSAEVVDAEQATGTIDGDAIVLGSPIYMGRWLKSARKIAEGLSRADDKRPLFLFACGPLGDPPQPDPPGAEALAGALAEKALEFRVFTGKLEESELNRRERMAVHAVKAPPGDYREIEAIEDFADSIAARLSRGGAAREVPT